MNLKKIILFSPIKLFQNLSKQWISSHYPIQNSTMAINSFTNIPMNAAAENIHFKVRKLWYVQKAHFLVVVSPASPMPAHLEHLRYSWPKAAVIRVRGEGGVGGGGDRGGVEALHARLPLHLHCVWTRLRIEALIHVFFAFYPFLLISWISCWNIMKNKDLRNITFDSCVWRSLKRSL